MAALVMKSCYWFPKSGMEKEKEKDQEKWVDVAMIGKVGQ